MRRSSKTVVILVTLCLIGLPQFHQDVTADEPITVGVTVVVVGGAILGAGAWLWNKLTAKPKTITTTTTEWTDARGVKHTFSIVREIDPEVSYRLPDDITSPFGADEGYSISEDMLLDARQDETVLIKHVITKLGADVLASPRDYVGYEVRRVTTMQFDRPPGEPLDSASQLDVNVDIQDLKLGTADVRNTRGSSHYSITIDSPQLGNLFNASGRVEQGGSFFSTGDISLAHYDVSPGNAVLNYNEILAVPIPSGLSNVNVVYTFITAGDGVQVSGPVVDLSLGIIVAIVIALLAVLAAILAILIARRGRTSP